VKYDGISYRPPDHSPTFGTTLHLIAGCWKCGGKVKAKAIPVDAWTDPEFSRRLRLPDFKTIGT